MDSSGGLRHALGVLGRFVIVLALIASASPVLAQAKIGDHLSIYRIHPGNQKTTLLDRKVNQFREVAVGDTVGDLRVTVIDANRVILTKTNADRSKIHIVLKLQSDNTGRSKTSYALFDMAKIFSGVLNVSATGSVASAPTKPGEMGVSSAPTTPSRTENAGGTSSGGTMEVTRSTQPTTSAVTPPPKGPITIKRSEFEAAMLNLFGLSQQVDGNLTKQGVVIKSVKPGTWVASLGVRAGDTVLAVAGRKITSLDDAATVYAKLQSRASFTIDMLRGGKKVTLTYQFDR